MAEATTTRRAMLGAMSAVPLAGLIAAVPVVAAKSAAGAERYEWNRLVARYERARAAYEAACEDCARRSRAFEADKPDMDRIHWREFTFQDRHHVAHRMDIEERWQQFLRAEGRSWWSRDPEATKARFRAALDSVLAYRREYEEAKQRHGVERAEDRTSRIGDREAELLGTLIKMPAPDLAALQWKLERLFGEAARGANEYSDSWSPEEMNAILADARRLLTREG